MYAKIQTVRFSATEYEIETPAAIYTAKPHFFGHSTTLFGPGGRDLATIKRPVSLVDYRYEFDLHQGNVHVFHSSDSYANAYVCDFESDSYTLFVHKGRRCSLFLGDTQIASISREAWTVGGEVVCDVLMNDDADIRVVSCFALAVLDMDHPQRGGAFYDFGNIGAEARPFDERWQPS